MKVKYNKPDQPLTIEATCVACGKQIAIGEGALRFFGEEEQIATQEGRPGRYAVHATLCPHLRQRVKGTIIDTITIGEHIVVFKWSGNETFPIAATINGKSSGRVYKSIYVAMPAIRQSLGLAPYAALAKAYLAKHTEKV